MVPRAKAAVAKDAVVVSLCAAACWKSTLAPILPSSIPTAIMTTPETTAGNSFRVRLMRDATAISQAPAKITMPQTAGKPNDAATARLDRR